MNYVPLFNAHLNSVAGKDWGQGAEGGNRGWDGWMASTIHWTWVWAMRSNQTILKEINPEYSPEGLMLKLKFQYIGYLTQRVNSLEKTLMLGKIEGRRQRGWQKTKWLDGTIVSIDMSLSKIQETVKDREAGHVPVQGIAKIWTWLNNKWACKDSEKT